MLEILAILFLCRKNAANATQRGRKPAGFVWLTIGLWVGMEILGGAIGTAAGLELGAYLIALLLAICGGVASYFITKNCKLGNAPINPAAAPQVKPAQSAVTRLAAESEKPMRATWVLALSVAVWLLQLLLRRMYAGRCVYTSTDCVGLLIAGLFGAAAYLMARPERRYKCIAASSGLAAAFMLSGNAAMHFGEMRIHLQNEVFRTAFAFRTPIYMGTLWKTLLYAALVLGCAALVSFLLRNRSQKTRTLITVGATAVTYIVVFLLFEFLLSLRPSRNSYPLWLASARWVPSYLWIDFIVLPAWLLGAAFLTSRLCGMPSRQVRLRGAGLVWSWIAAISLTLTFLITLFIAGDGTELLTYTSQLTMLMCGITGYILLLCKRRAGLYFLLLGVVPMMLGQAVSAIVMLKTETLSIRVEESYTLMAFSSLVGLINPLLGWLSVRSADKRAGICYQSAPIPAPIPAPQPGARSLFCMSCGQRLRENARFCQNCGTPVTSVTFAPASPAPAEAEQAIRPEAPAQEPAPIAVPMAPPPPTETPQAMQPEAPVQEPAPIAVPMAPPPPTETPQAMQPEAPAQEPAPIVAAESMPDAVIRAAAPAASEDIQKPLPVMTQTFQPEQRMPKAKRGLFARMSKRMRILTGVGAALILVGVILIFVLTSNGKQTRYNDAVTLLENGRYSEASRILSTLGKFEDADELRDYAISMIHYEDGRKAMEEGDYAHAALYFSMAGDVLDAPALAEQCEALDPGDAPLDSAETTSGVTGETLPMPKLDSDGKDRDGMELPVPGDGEALYLGTMEYDKAALSKMAFILSADGDSVHHVTIFNKDVSLTIPQTSTSIKNMTVTESYQASYDSADFDKLSLGKSTLYNLAFDGDTATGELDYVYTHRSFGNNSQTYEMPFGRATVQFERIAGSAPSTANAEDADKSEPDAAPTAKPEDSTAPVSGASANGASAPIQYENSTYRVSIGEIKLNEDGNRTIELLGTGIGAKIPFRNGSMITILQMKMVAGGKTYGWENANISRDVFTFTFETDAEPETIIVYPHGGANDETQQLVYDVAQGEFRTLS